MEIKEFNHLKQIKDELNPFSLCYEVSDAIFYVEPAFLTMLNNLKEMYSPDDYSRVINKMVEVAKERKRVIYTYDYENPLTKKDGFIYLELTDITDMLQIYIEDKSRGSDYGD